MNCSEKQSKKQKNSYYRFQIAWCLQRSETTGNPATTKTYILNKTDQKLSVLSGWFLGLEVNDVGVIQIHLCRQ